MSAPAPPDPPPSAAARLRERRVLGALLLLAALAFGTILQPFYGTVLWAAVIALLFAPLNRWLLRHCGQRATPAALLTMLAALLLAVLPVVMVSAALVGEASQVYGRLASGELNPARYLHRLYDALPPWAEALLHRAGLGNFDALQGRLVALITQGSALIAGQALGLGQNTFDLALSACITLYLAFFMLRDGAALVRRLRPAVPLSRVHTQALIDKFSAVLRATVKGNLLVALIQGALGGLAFWFLGVGGALLWAVLMAFLSLLPAVGAALVWAPVAGWFLLNGQIGAGLGLVAWGAGVIGLVDNLLRPMLVGQDTRLPDYLVMISTLGGMAVFGLNGFVIGPLIAAMFMAVAHLYSETHREPATGPR